ncbi:MAG: alpha/beta hydrolase [Flavobacteriales bacterium]
MNSFLLAFLALLLLYGALCFLIYRLQEKRIFQPGRLPKDVDLGISAPHKERWISVADGSALNAVHLRVDSPKGLILYHHGNSGDLSEWKNVASLLLPYGYDVLVYDYRGYGKSPGRIENEDQLLQDGQKVYEAMAEEYGENRILLYGRSLGTGIASYLAAFNRPASLLLESPFYSMRELVFQYYPWIPLPLILKYPLRNDRYLESVECPIHIFHGDRDGVIDHRSTLKLKKLLKEGDCFYTIKGGHHADLSEFQEYHEALKVALTNYSGGGDQTGKVRSAS